MANEALESAPFRALADIASRSILIDKLGLNAFRRAEITDYGLICSGCGGYLHRDFCNKDKVDEQSYCGCDEPLDFDGQGIA